MWTLDVDEILATTGNAGMHEYGKKCAADLDEVVKLVRGDLPKLTRKTLAPLIVMDVHARDVILQVIRVTPPPPPPRAQRLTCYV